MCSNVRWRRDRRDTVEHPFRHSAHLDVLQDRYLHSKCTLILFKSNVFNQHNLFAIKGVDFVRHLNWGGIRQGIFSQVLTKFTSNGPIHLRVPN